MNENVERTRWNYVFGMLLLIYWAALFSGTHLPISLEGLPGKSDKYLHFAAYAGLAFLLAMFWRARYGFSWRSMATVLLIAAAYGVADELLQVPIPGRYGDVNDWLADVMGATVGICLFVACDAIVNR